MRLEGLRDTYIVRCTLSRLLTNFAYCLFFSGFSLDDFYMVTGLSRYNLEVISHHSVF